MGNFIFHDCCNGDERKQKRFDKERKCGCGVVVVRIICDDSRNNFFQSNRELINHRIPYESSHRMDDNIPIAHRKML